MTFNAAIVEPGSRYCSSLYHRTGALPGGCLWSSAHVHNLVAICLQALVPVSRISIYSRDMTIAGVASAFPPHRYDQSFLLSALQRQWGSKLNNPSFMAKVQAHVGVETRHLALPIQDYYDLKTCGRANNHWIEIAQDIGQKALCGALARAGV